MSLICTVSSSMMTLKAQMNMCQAILRQISEERQDISSQMLEQLAKNGSNKDDVQYVYLQNEDQKLDLNQIQYENMYALYSENFKSTQQEYQNNVKDSGFKFSVS